MGAQQIFRVSLAQETHDIFGFEIEDSEYALPRDRGPRRMNRILEDMTAIYLNVTNLVLFPKKIRTLYQRVMLPIGSLYNLTTGTASRKEYHILSIAD